MVDVVESAVESDQVTFGKLIERNVNVIERAVESSQPRLMMRVLRQNAPIRKHASAETLAAKIREIMPEAAALKPAVLAALAKVAAAAPDESCGANEAAGAASEVPEVEVYLLTLGVSTLLRSGDAAGAAALCGGVVDRLRELAARRTLDPLGARVYALFGQAHEQLGSTDEIRGALFAAHRTACLGHNEFGEAVVLNLLLRALLAADQVEAAFKLVSKTAFPEQASNNQLCRYLFYTGRMQALRLDYTDAHAKLTQASRKAPGNTALGFRRAVQKLTVLVQLLMGELPERAAFAGAGFQKAMAPYLELARAVRNGDMTDYTRVVALRGARFAQDRTSTLVARLSQNVVKTGLRRITTSYSRIALVDIQAALQLDSARAAEFVAAKAIADGLIDAVLDHDAQSMRSSGVADAYATDEPQKAFHRRITFCLDVHNEAVKAMLYPDAAAQKIDETWEIKNEVSDKKTPEEVAKEIQDELQEDD
ncbi:proteasome regulatory subunit C-terminal-domain-containing protein [Pelagophyceae sp. CCMP2097]|nr:proteasome regulatory subunit C-terminal-domain-containing protein [Pelagophyceae sp. CCMP2097]|mmetsp:Transcript_6870/g.22263  ORF Transcript_6870/g.22263 Transcript_6870/m.22263 type:complete len:481 (+) Transcript_6870:90-1532(+)